MRKEMFLFCLIALFLISNASAISLEIDKKPVRDAYIIELGKPIIFDFTIKNTGETDEFLIYNLVGVDMTPEEYVKIEKDRTKTIRIEMIPQKSLIDKNVGYYTFLYKIKGNKTGVQEDKLTIKIIHLGDAFEISGESIELNSSRVNFYMKNRENYNFNDMKVDFTSAFFSRTDTFSLAPYEKKEFSIVLDKEKIKKLIAGVYPITADIEFAGITGKTESFLKFEEKSNIKITHESYGFIITYIIDEKINEGNIPIIVEIREKRNILANLFTTFNTEPLTSGREGIYVEYSWQKELNPSDSLKVKMTTNWLFPVIILIAIAAIVFFVKSYTETALVLRKRLVFVKTKGGEFALKIILSISARKYAEKIKVIDRLPSLVKLYERYGTIEPDKIDEKHRKLEWNIESLNAGEERVLSYIIYSKVGVIGKFALPTAVAFYETEGQTKEAYSNQAFFVSEPKSSEEEA